jgi:membrane dipeptidase
MNLIDFHCDTLSECYNRKSELYKNDLHIDLERGKRVFNKYCQVFAVWIPDEKRGDEAYDYFNNVYAFFEKQLLKNYNTVAFCRSSGEMDNAFGENKIAAFLSVEGGAVLGGDIDVIDALYEKGVRILTLTWNGQNELGDGCFTENAKGLSPFGVNCVKKLQKKGIIVDVSHLSERGFYDVAEYSEKPFIATHSDCDIVDNPFAEKRNLTDAQIRIITEQKGIIGLNLYEKFLGVENGAGLCSVIRQIEHFCSLGAEHTICFGCDFDGCTVSDDLCGIDKLYKIANGLARENYSDELINGIFFDNANAFIVANM